MAMDLSRQPALTYDKNVEGRPLYARERAEIMEPLLPDPLAPSPGVQASRTTIRTTAGLNSSLPSPRLTYRDFLLWLLFKIAFYALQLSFSFYSRLGLLLNSLRSRFWSILYYHHRSSEIIRRDVAALPRIPRHLSVIVDNSPGRGASERHESYRLLSDIAELCAWCASVKIPQLSIYEQYGTIKTMQPELSRVMSRVFGFYFSPSAMPVFDIVSAQETPGTTKALVEKDAKEFRQSNIDIILLSEHDGRGTVVDLTRTLADMSQRGKIQTGEVSVELINTELAEASCGDPDLLIMMTNSRQLMDFHWRSYLPSWSPPNMKKQQTNDAGTTRPYQIATGSEVCLRGYPPWQARLTEIFSRPGGSGIDYQTFLEALHKYAKAEMRLGR